MESISANTNFYQEEGKQALREVESVSCWKWIRKFLEEEQEEEEEEFELPLSHRNIVGASFLLFVGIISFLPFWWIFVSASLLSLPFSTRMYLSLSLSFFFSLFTCAGQSLISWSLCTITSHGDWAFCLGMSPANSSTLSSQLVLVIKTARTTATAFTFTSCCSSSHETHRRINCKSVFWIWVCQTVLCLLCSSYLCLLFSSCLFLSVSFCVSHSIPLFPVSQSLRSAFVCLFAYFLLCLTSRLYGSREWNEEYQATYAFPSATIQER